MNRKLRFYALLTAVLFCAGWLTGCSKNTPVPTDPQAGQQVDDTLVVGTQHFDGKFSPFFYTNAYEADVWELVHLSLLETDREGAVVLQGIKGETRPYNGTDYTYTGIADCIVTENADGTVFYDFMLKEGVTFSDGTQVDIDDVLFSLYVPLDPTYDGIMTLYSLPIQGLEAYRSGIETVGALIWKTGRAGYTATDQYTREQYQRFWEAVDATGTDPEDEQFPAALSAALAEDLVDYTTGVQTGASAPSISGIRKTGERSLRIVMTELSATAIYNLAIPVVPMHYYGDPTLYDYENGQFGFPKGDLSGVRDKTTQPMGGGPYRFVSYRGGTVTLEANPRYWKGQPKIRYIQFKEGQDADKVPGVVSGTLDIADPSYSTETAKAIAAANGGGISGSVLTTVLSANPGYGYIGFNTQLVNVGGENGSEASRNLRKALATVISVYRDVAVNSYYGEYAEVIQYPISDTSWAAPRVTDPNYRTAFSVNVRGEGIYTSDMTPQQRYAAAETAALEYFQAAGYTVTDGVLTDAPAGASLSCEVLVSGGGTGDHPTFMALTLAAESLKRIGFDLTVTDVSDFTQLSNAVNAGTAQMFAMAWSATPDPDLYQIYHSLGGSNEKAYWIKDETLDELILLARKSTDRDYRRTLYRECLDMIADWAVEIPMYQRQNAVIFSTQRVNMDTVTPDITTFWGWENDIEKLELASR